MPRVFINEEQFVALQHALRVLLRERAFPLTPLEREQLHQIDRRMARMRERERGDDEHQK